MIFERLQATPALADIVESIWLQEDLCPDTPRTASSVLPTGTVEILFHYGDRFSHIEPDGLEAVTDGYVDLELVVGRQRMAELEAVFARPSGCRPKRSRGSCDSRKRYACIETRS